MSRWIQVPEPEGALFSGIMPSTQRAWFHGTLVVPEDTDPWNRYEHAERDIATLGTSFTVCVDYEVRWAMYLCFKDSWRWQHSYVWNTLINDPEFFELVKATTPEEMPPAEKAPDPPVQECPTLGIQARMTGPYTWELVSPDSQPLTKHEKRMQARKGWR